MLQIIIVLLKGASSIIWRVDVDTLYTPGILALQGFQSQKVIAVDQHVFSVGIGGAVGTGSVFDKIRGSAQVNH